ncbi:transglycosylase domain-containing protein [bacterium]|nr:transglycosylase domain-containing protein [bacterium]
MGTDPNSTNGRRGAKVPYRPASGRAKPAGTPFQRFIARAALVIGYVALLGLLLLAVGLWFLNEAYREVRRNINSLVNTDLPEGSQATRIYARDYNPQNGHGTLLGVVVGQENRQSVSYDQIPPLLIACLLSTEDKDFFYHGGVDFKGTTRALVRILRRGGEVKGGGSTITQQLARNVYLPSIKSEKTLNRKIQEAIFASALEQRFTKQGLLESYLNYSNLGGMTYGVKAAARKYFAKDLASLTLAECALLAGMPQAPTSYNPYYHPEAAESRRKEVLRLLKRRLDSDFFEKLEQADPQKFKNLKITAEEIDAAIANPPKFKKWRDETIMHAPYFTTYLKDIVLPRSYDEDRVMNQGLIFQTTIDPQIQQWAEQILKEKIDKYRKGSRVSQGAVVVMEAHSGEVLACVGGYQWDSPNAKGEPDKYNRAMLASRQVGSSFKPFVYATAYEQGFPTSLLLRDAPLRNVNGKPWPTNSGGGYSGMVSIFFAFQMSKNAACVDLANNFTGIPAVIETARRMGISAELPEVESLPLGVADIRPVEMAEAFTTFPNMGRHVKHSMIRRVYSNNGVLLESNDGETAIAARSNQAISTETAWIMIQNMQRCVERGTGGRARVDGMTICGKTGTCEDYSDAWFVGYSPELVIAVWVGNDDYKKKMNRMFGGNCPAETFGALMSKIHSSHAKYKKGKFDKPEGVKFSGFGSAVTGGALPGAEKTEEEKAAEEAKKKEEAGGGGDDNGFYEQWQPPREGDVFF